MRPPRTEPTQLSVEQDGDHYVLALDGAPLDTIGQNPVRHEAPQLIEHMIGEFMRYPEISVADNQIVAPQFLGAYRLFGLQKQFIEPRTDNLTENFAFELACDPVLHQIAGPEQRDRLARYDAVMRWFDDEGLQLVDMDYVDRNTIDAPQGGGLLWMSSQAGTHATDEFHRLASVLGERFQGLTPEERACVVYLHNGLSGAVVHAMGLVLGRLNANDFATGVGAAQHMLDQFPDVSSATHSDIFGELRGHATAALEYIAAYRAGTVQGRLRDLLAQDESTDVEFKSTLRWNMRDGRKDRAMTDAVIKTVAAFLNTKGGTLLIGVADNKDIVGIELDQFDTDDDLLKHLYQVIQNALGPAATPLIATSIVDAGRGKVCIVDCERSPEPLFCNTKQYEDAFFVRTGPKTDNLVGAARDDFLRVHWGRASS